MNWFYLSLVIAFVFASLSVFFAGAGEKLWSYLTFFIFLVFIAVTAQTHKDESGTPFSQEQLKENKAHKAIAYCEVEGKHLVFIKNEGGEKFYWVDRKVQPGQKFAVLKDIEVYELLSEPDIVYWLRDTPERKDLGPAK